MRQGRRGLTFVELLIASAIFIIVMVTVYSAVHIGIFGYRNIEEALEASLAARQILERINLDLKNSFAYSTEKSMFSGNNKGISFYALVDTFYQGRITQDYAFISYKLEQNKLKRLSLRNEETLEQPEKEGEEFIAKIEEMNFSYAKLKQGSSEIEWQDYWDDIKALPVAIKIKLAIKNKVKQDFQRTVYLPI